MKLTKSAFGNSLFALLILVGACPSYAADKEGSKPAAGNNTAATTGAKPAVTKATTLTPSAPATGAKLPSDAKVTEKTTVTTKTTVKTGGAAKTSTTTTTKTTSVPAQRTGRPSVFDFSAVWCGPCKKFAPIYDKVANDYKGKVDFYHVDVDDPKQKALVDKYKITVMPTVVFVDATGKAKLIRENVMPEAELVQEVNNLLK